MRTTVAPVLFDESWDSEATMEYQRGSQFSGYIGAGTRNAIIYKKLDSQTDNVAFVPDLTGTFINGDNRLKGNETPMQSYHETVTAEWLRKAVEFTKRTQKFTAFNVRKAAKDSVTNFYKNAMRTRIIDALLSARNSISAGTNSLYGTIVDGTNGPEITSATTNGAAITTIEGVTTTSADETLKDGWLAANSDRVLFGSLVSNNAANDHSAALATIDTTDDTPRASQLGLLKRRCKLASPKIHPFKLGENGLEWFLYLVGSRGFRDYQADPEIRQADLDARERGLSNPVFTGGELLYNGVIIKEVEEMPVITAVGASSADVGVGCMIGAQAIAYGSYQDMESIADIDDFGFAMALGTECCDIYKKIFFNGKQHGVHTHYFAASPDA